MEAFTIKARARAFAPASPMLSAAILESVHASGQQANRGTHVVAQAPPGLSSYAVTQQWPPFQSRARHRLTRKQVSATHATAAAWSSGACSPTHQKIVSARSASCHVGALRRVRSHQQCRMLGLQTPDLCTIRFSDKARSVRTFQFQCSQHTRVPQQRACDCCSAKGTNIVTCVRVG